MRQAGHVACMEEERKVYKVLVKKPEGKRPLGEKGIDGRIGSEWILGRLAGTGGVNWIGFDWLRIGTSGKLI
jgi:hypothetical protein